MPTIPSAVANRDEYGVSSWSKNVQDLNNVDESFANARDAGYLRLNVARNSIVGSLSAKYDSVDIYKLQAQSNGKLSMSIRGGLDKDADVLDLSKYQETMDATQKLIDEAEKLKDPVAWEKKQQEKKLAELEAEANKKLISETAPGIRVEVYMVKNGKEVLIGDSHAEKGTKTRDAMDQIMTGSYKATKGTYFIKVSRDDTVDEKDEVPYAIQTMIGTKYKHDYVVQESASDDTKNKKLSSRASIAAVGTYRLSQADILTIQASKYQTTADMLAVGYLNMADIYNKNSKK